MQSAPNFGVLDTVLNTFRTLIDAGYPTAQATLGSLEAELMGISIALLAASWVIEGDAVMRGVHRRIVSWAIWLTIIANWQTWSLAMFSAAGALGIQLGGGSGALGDFLNFPSKIVNQGGQNAQKLFDLGSYYMGVTTVSWGPAPAAPLNPLDLIAAAVKDIIFEVEAIACGLMILLAYFWIALEVVCVVIEFHIVLLIACLILPFGLLERTFAYAERAVTYVVGACLKVAALGIVISVGSQFLTNNNALASFSITPSTPAPSLDQMGGVLLGALIILMLALRAPAYASSVVTGATSSGAGAMAGAAALALGVAGAGIGLARGAAGVLSHLPTRPPGGPPPPLPPNDPPGGGGPSSAPSPSGNSPPPTSGGASYSSNGGAGPDLGSRPTQSSPAPQKSNSQRGVLDHVQDLTDGAKKLADQAKNIAHQ